MAIPLVLKKLLVRTGLARWFPAAKYADGGYDYLRYYADRVLAAPLPELLDPVTFPACDSPDVMDLNLPAPRLDSPSAAGRPASDRNGLPPASGLQELRERISDTYRERDGRALDPRTDVLVTHGATGAFAAALDALTADARAVRTCWTFSHTSGSTRASQNPGTRTWSSAEFASMTRRSPTTPVLCASQSSSPL